ncbi:hypothetical protein BKA66DRAFT_67751 [Pyrenochaeta sp. MPI-SDFR-AT-0127]|nr:hypothetical protein BKA66DRAFT_67751 [Pyrenochaeta sp. MPI-SDFR-AT-0127]
MKETVRNFQFLQPTVHKDRLTTRSSSTDMEASKPMFSGRADSDTSESSLKGPRDISREEHNQFLAQVKKALAFCRRCKRLSWSKNRAESLESIGLQSMSSTTSNVSRSQNIKARPMALGIERERLPNTHGHQLSPSYSYTESAESDPFITSPSWLKAEFTMNETRL